MTNRIYNCGNRIYDSFIHTVKEYILRPAAPREELGIQFVDKVVSFIIKVMATPDFEVVEYFVHNARGYPAKVGPQHAGWKFSLNSDDRISAFSAI